MFAAVSGNVIQVYSFTTFENILNLKGHSGKVSNALCVQRRPALTLISNETDFLFLQIRGIEWRPDDSRLVSCGMDGAVYEWNTQTAKRESESVLQSCSYTDVAFSADCKTILAVGTDLTLKEIQDCQVSRYIR